MSHEQFIAKRLTSKESGNLSRPFVRIATVAIALSLAVMIVAVAIVTGFKEEIREKTIGFGSHIRIVNYDSNISFESNPIYSDQDFLPELMEIDGIRHIQKFAHKPGIIRTDTDIQGVVLKGVDAEFDWGFFENNLVEGAIPNLNDSTTSNEAIISQTIAQRLKLNIGDTFDMFFVQDPPRIRRFTIAGIFDSQMAEFDRLFVLGDLRHIQRLNGWDLNQITGFEILIHNFLAIEEVAEQVRDLVSLNFMMDGAMLRVQSIIDMYPQIFGWLGLQDLNVIILLALMLAVAGINMISGLLIIILERTNMIGILKALGAENNFIRRIFIIQSGHIIVRGLLWGNLVGLLLCILQQQFGFITLDQANYYLSEVPINLTITNILLLNLGTFVVTITMLLVPSMVVSRISPDRTIKYD